MKDFFGVRHKVYSRFETLDIVPGLSVQNSPIQNSPKQNSPEKYENERKNSPIQNSPKNSLN